MLISLSRTIVDAGQLFRSRYEGSKSAVQNQKILTDKRAPLSKLFHNRTSTDSVARLSRWYKGRLLSDAEKDKGDSFLLETGSLIHFGLQLFETLAALSEKANELNTGFNALASEEQEHEYPHIQEELQTIYAKQQKIYALLDDSAPEEDQKELPISIEMQETGTELAPMGLLQQVQALDQKLSVIEQEEDSHTTSLVKYFLSIPRTETVICTIASVVTAVGIGLQLPLFICCVSIVVSIAMAVIRFVNFISSDKRHAKNNDVLILRREVIGSYMNILNEMISAIFQIKQDTTDIKGTLVRLESQNQRLEQKLDSAPPAITHNTYNVIQVVDPKYLLPPEQQLLLGQGSTRPAIMLSGEGHESTKTLVNYQPRARKISSSSLTSNSSSVSASPIIGRFPSPEIEEEESPFAQHNASSSKGKGRADPTIFEEHNIEELFSSDSESDSDAVLTVEEKAQKAARAQRKAAKNAKIKALAERNAQLEALFQQKVEAEVKVQVKAKLEQMLQFA